MDLGAYETVTLFEFQQHHPDQYLIMAGTEHCRMLQTSPEARLGQRPMGDTRFPYDEVIISWSDRSGARGRRLAAHAEGAGLPDGRVHLAGRRLLAAA